MIHLNEAVVVEGKYDLIKLDSVTDALTVKLDGFNIYKNREKQNYIKKLAAERGIILLTDADSAGFRLRAFVSDICKNGNVYHAYVPAVKGREKRKTASGKEGLLGVEGISVSDVEKALTDAVPKAGEEPKKIYSTALFYELGLSGKADSAQKRRELASKLSLPPRISTASLIKYLNTAAVPAETVEKLLPK